MFFERTPKCLSSGRIWNAMDDSTLNLRVFDLHYANLQAIGKAQKVHLTTLMVYLGVVWGWYIIGEGTSVIIQMLGLAIKAKGFWVATPLIVTFFSLALIGSVNAAGPARKKIDAALEKLGMEKEFEFYSTIWIRTRMCWTTLHTFGYARRKPCPKWGINAFESGTSSTSPQCSLGFIRPGLQCDALSCRACFGSGCTQEHA